MCMDVGVDELCECGCGCRSESRSVGVGVGESGAARQAGDPLRWTDGISISRRRHPAPACRSSVGRHFVTGLNPPPKRQISCRRVVLVSNSIIQ